MILWYPLISLCISCLSSASVVDQQFRQHSSSIITRSDREKALGNRNGGSDPYGWDKSTSLGSFHCKTQNRAPDIELKVLNGQGQNKNSATKSRSSPNKKKETNSINPPATTRERARDPGSLNKSKESGRRRLSPDEKQVTNSPSRSKDSTKTTIAGLDSNENAPALGKSKASPNRNKNSGSSSKSRSSSHKSYDKDSTSKPMLYNDKNGDIPHTTKRRVSSKEDDQNIASPSRSRFSKGTESSSHEKSESTKIRNKSMPAPSIPRSSPDSDKELSPSKYKLSGGKSPTRKSGFAQDRQSLAIQRAASAPASKSVSFESSESTRKSIRPVSAYAIASGPGSIVEHSASGAARRKERKTKKLTKPVFTGHEDADSVKATAVVLSDNGKASATATGWRVNGALQTSEKGGSIEYRAGNLKPLKEKVGPDEYRYVEMNAADHFGTNDPSKQVTLTTHLHGSGRCSSRSCNY